MFLFVLIASVGFTQTGSAFPFNSGKYNTPTEDMLDVMQELLAGGGQFNRNFVKKVRSCMATIDPKLSDVHDSTWQGLIDYWDMGGAPDDPWGKSRSKFSECNATESSYKKMIIYEPCNFASNVAYYHLLNELCYRRSSGRQFHLRPEYITALGKMFAALVPVSSFLHATNTKLGYQQDVGVIEIIGYLLLQGLMEALPYPSPILNDLRPVPRQMTSLQVVDAVQKMHSTEPVSKWYKTFEALDFPGYISIAAILHTLVHMNFDGHLANLLHPVINNAVGITTEEQRFLTQDFLPELRRATSHMNRKRNSRNHFLPNTLGSLTKILYAYVWHEFRLVNSSIIFKPLTNVLGSELLPRLNKKMNGVTNYRFYQPDFQRGVNVYPGEQWCNPKFAHPKWHVQTSIMLVDVTYLVDEMHRLLRPT